MHYLDLNLSMEPTSVLFEARVIKLIPRVSAVRPITKNTSAMVNSRFVGYPLLASGDTPVIAPARGLLSDFGVPYGMSGIQEIKEIASESFSMLASFAGSVLAASALLNTNYEKFKSESGSENLLEMFSLDNLPPASADIWKLPRIPSKSSENLSPEKPEYSLASLDSISSEDEAENEVSFSDIMAFVDRNFSETEKTSQKVCAVDSMFEETPTRLFALKFLHRHLSMKEIMYVVNTVLNINSAILQGILTSFYADHGIVILSFHDQRDCMEIFYTISKMLDNSRTWSVGGEIDRNGFQVWGLLSASYVKETFLGQYFENSVPHKATVIGNFREMVTAKPNIIVTLNRSASEKWTEDIWLWLPELKNMLISLGDIQSCEVIDQESDQKLNGRSSYQLLVCFYDIRNSQNAQYRLDGIKFKEFMVTCSFAETPVSKKGSLAAKSALWRERPLATLPSWDSNGSFNHERRRVSMSEAIPGADNIWSFSRNGDMKPRPVQEPVSPERPVQFQASPERQAQFQERQAFSMPTTPVKMQSSLDRSTSQTYVNNNSYGGQSQNSNEVNVSRIESQLDDRTTCMIRNIPNKYTQQMLLDFIDETHQGCYDFIYLRMDFKNRCNVGYAFINFIDAKYIVSFSNRVSGKKWSKFNSEKICSLSYANIQGKNALIEKFRNSSVMEEEQSYRPKIFHSSGPYRGKEEQFPVSDEQSRTCSKPGVYVQPQFKPASEEFRPAVGTNMSRSLSDRQRSQQFRVPSEGLMRRNSNTHFEPEGLARRNSTSQFEPKTLWNTRSFLDSPKPMVTEPWDPFNF